jgi:hypothetical protein
MITTENNAWFSGFKADHFIPVFLPDFTLLLPVNYHGIH